MDLGPQAVKRVMIKLNPKNVSNLDVVTIGVGGSRASVALNVSGYERIDEICNICAASGLP